MSLKFDFDLVVVGGGITGLASSFFALKSGNFQSVCLLEPALPGGVISSYSFEDIEVDIGPDSILYTREPVKILFSELNLKPLYPYNSEVMIYTKGQLRNLPKENFMGIPANPKDLKPTGLLTGAGYYMLKRDRFKRRYKGGDITIAELIEPRLGKEALEVLVEPFVAGINAGVASYLSAHAVAPELVAFCSNYGSLTKAVKKYLNKKKNTPSSLVSVQGGINKLVEIVVDVLKKAKPFSLKTSEVKSISYKKSLFEIETTQGNLNANKVIVALPAKDLSKISLNFDQQFLTWINSLKHASVATLTLIVNEEELPKQYLARGYLIPRNENMLLTAATFLSQKWQYYKKEGIEIIKLSAGHFLDPRVTELPDNQIQQILLDEFNTILDTDIQPVNPVLRVYKDAFCQYPVGHLLNASKVIQATEDKVDHKLKLVGSYFRGVGISSRISASFDAIKSLT